MHAVFGSQLRSDRKGDRRSTQFVQTQTAFGLSCGELADGQAVAKDFLIART